MPGIPHCVFFCVYTYLTFTEWINTGCLHRLERHRCET